MSRRSFAQRALLIVAFATILSHWLRTGMVFEHDLLKSFAPKDALDSILIGEYQHLGPFSGKVFIDGGGLSAEESNRVRTEMLAAGFRSMADEPLTNTKLKSAGALLGGSWIKETGQSAAHVTRAVRDVSLFLSLPGMGDAAMKADPLGLLRSFSPSTSGASKVSIAQDAVARRGIQIWASPQPYNPESSARLWTLAQSFVGKAYFIGEDLFRLTNEGAVRRDVARASSISFVLNAVVFFMFIRNWYFLGVFLVGTAASWLAIFFALRICFSEVYPIVFAFASTFFSFNAEYLVHLCGVESERKKIIRRAMISAVGTTLIGLVVLLGSSSSLIREMAVAAIAGLVGFFVGTIPFASLLASIRFVSTPRLRNFVGFRFLKHFNFRIPSVLKKLFGSLKWWSLLAAICLLVIPFSGWPPVRTDVSQFRFAPDLLETAEKHFSSLLSDDLSFYAIPSQDLPKIGHDFEASVYRSAEIVSKDFHGSMKSVKSFATDVAMQLGRVGFDLDAETLLEPYHLDEDAANAEVWRASSIFAGSMFLGAGSWSVITASSKETEGWLQSGQRLFKMDVRSYYNDLLTDQSLSMLGLFAFGFCGMIAYLAIVQRSLRKVIVIVMPLIVFFLAGSAVLSVFRIPLNIIHGIGLVLVIGFALDYTAIAVSTAFSSPDMSKILITGASTIASFCGLCFAEHPFLQMLGFVVVPGVFLSLFFALAIDKFEVGQFLNRPKGGICGSVLPVLCLLSILLVGCVTPKVLKLSSGLEYGHPKNFVAEQSVCVLAKGQRTCFLGELSRKDSEFSLAILEPTMLSLLLVAESPAEHEVHAEIRSKYEFLDRIDPKFIMDTIRQLHEKSNLVLNRGVVLLNIPGGSNISVAYQWGEVVRAGCPYPEDLRLDFPKIGNAPPLSLLVTNTKVVCDVTKSGDRL